MASFRCPKVVPGLVLVVVLLSPGPAGAESVEKAPRIDLTRLPAFVRPGFEPDWVKLSAPGEPEWRRFAPAPKGERKIRIKDLQFPDFPRKSFFSLKHHSPRSATILIPFSLKRVPGETEVTGLLLAHIGERWEVYLNGRRLARRMDPRKNSLIRGLLVPLPAALLRTGPNTLALRVEGDPVSPYFGLYRSKPYLVGPYDVLHNMRTDRVQLVLIFLYFFVGLLHVFLWLRRRSETYNLFFGLFAIVVFVYFSSRHRYITRLFDDFDLLRRLELASLFFLVPLVGTFFEVILIERVGKMTRFNYALSVALALAVLLPTPLPFTQDILLLWQLNTLCIFIPFYVFYRLGGRLLAERRRLIAGANAAEIGMFGRFGHVLFNTVPGNLSLGALVLVVCTVYDIMDSMFFALGFRASQFGFLLFVGGIILILANRFQSMHAEVADLNVHLREKIEDLNRANEELKFSEEQYRRLFDGSAEIIFTLDGQGRILTVNRAFLRQLQYRPGQVPDLSVGDLLFAGAEDRGLAHGLLERKLEVCRREGRPDKLRLTLQSSRGEPIELNLAFERIRAGDVPEILARGVRLTEDALLRYFISEKQKYSIENFLVTAEEISQRLVRNVARYIAPEELTPFRVALREVIINAIEHGNLGITYDEKNRAMMADRYQEFIAERQRLPENRDKRVGIDFVLTPEKIVYHIADQGKGFDFEKTREKARRETETARQHGRGILITEEVFDEIHYSDRGNEVMLVKYFQNGKGAV